MMLDGGLTESEIGVHREEFTFPQCLEETCAEDLPSTVASLRYPQKEPSRGFECFDRTREACSRLGGVQSAVSGNLPSGGVF